MQQPIELFYNEFTEYTFGDMASEDFHITLSGAAKGLETKIHRCLEVPVS